tara:strand:+ start:39 stop:1643 length:1605 start_codon:yes stop_codon:yes gene_type:complete
MKQIIKTFNNLIKKTIFKVRNKTNLNFKIKHLNIVKRFNKSIEETIFKVQSKTSLKLFRVHSKTSLKLPISKFNKFLITFISLLFLYIFYLLIPLLYDKDWVKNNIQVKMLSEFKINLDYINDISYRILPAPHFLIKDSKILSNNPTNEKSIAEIRNLKIFLSQINFFDKEKISIEEVIINSANFYLLRNDLKVLNDFTDDKFSNKKIQINKSNIFFKDNFDEIVTIIKVDKALFFFNDKKLQNQFDLRGNIFATPFTFALKNKINLSIEKKILFKAKSLNLNIFNKSILRKNHSTFGSNIISFLNSKINTEYELIDKNIIFKSKNSKLNNSRIDYDGVLSINPFDLDLNIILNNNKISKLFNFNPILIEFLKSGLLFNENVSLNTTITVNSNRIEDFFDDAKIYLNIVNGKINLDNSKFINNNIGLLKLSDSNLFLQDDKLILNTDILIDIKNPNSLFSFLNTSKKFRKNIKNILVNLDYDFLNNEIKFNNVKIDNNETSDQFMNIIEGFDNNSNNLIRTRRLLNELISVYEG